MAKIIAKATVKKPAKKQSAKKSAKSSSTKTAKKKPTKKSPKKKKEDLNCFLTTACVKQYGLADNCYELNLLRKYRDEYLLKSVDGRMLVQNYYLVAPQILEHMFSDPKKEKHFSYIYNQVLSSCEAIEHQKLKKAKRIYKEMVNTLSRFYAL